LFFSLQIASLFSDLHVLIAHYLNILHASDPTGLGRMLGFVKVSSRPRIVLSPAPKPVTCLGVAETMPAALPRSFTVSPPSPDCACCKPSRRCLPRSPRYHPNDSQVHTLYLGIYRDMMM